MSSIDYRDKTQLEKFFLLFNERAKVTLDDTEDGFLKLNIYVPKEKIDFIRYFFVVYMPVGTFVNVMPLAFHECRGVGRKIWVRHKGLERWVS